MDHIVYLDRKAGELARLLDGHKRMIARGAAGRKLPYGRVNAGDTLYFVENDGSGHVQARAEVAAVVQSEKLAPEAARALLEEYREALALTPAQLERWSAKRYLVLVEVLGVKPLEPFAFDRTAYGNMDDWLPVGDIAAVAATED